MSRDGSTPKRSKSKHSSRRHRRRLNADLYDDKEEDKRDDWAKKPLSPDSLWKELQFQSYLKNRMRQKMQAKSKVVDNKGRLVTLAERIIRYKLNNTENTVTEEAPSTSTEAIPSEEKKGNLANLLQQYIDQRQSETAISSQLLGEISNAKTILNENEYRQALRSGSSISLGDSATNYNAKVRVIQIAGDDSKSNKDDVFELEGNSESGGKSEIDKTSVVRFQDSVDVNMENIETMESGKESRDRQVEVNSEKREDENENLTETLEKTEAESEKLTETLERTEAEGDTMTQTLERTEAEGDAMTQKLERTKAEGDVMTQTLERTEAEGDVRTQTLERTEAEGDAMAQTLERTGMEGENVIQTSKRTEAEDGNMTNILEKAEPDGENDVTQTSDYMMSETTENVAIADDNRDSNSNNKDEDNCPVTDGGESGVTNSLTETVTIPFESDHECMNDTIDDFDVNSTTITPRECEVDNDNNNKKEVVINSDQKSEKDRANENSEDKNQNVQRIERKIYSNANRAYFFNGYSLERAYTLPELVPADSRAVFAGYNDLTNRKRGQKLTLITSPKGSNTTVTSHILPNMSYKSYVPSPTTQNNNSDEKIPSNSLQAPVVKEASSSCPNFDFYEGNQHASSSESDQGSTDDDIEDSGFLEHREDSSYGLFNPAIGREKESDKPRKLNPDWQPQNGIVPFQDIPDREKRVIGLYNELKYCSMLQLGRPSIAIAVTSRPNGLNDVFIEWRTFREFKNTELHTQQSNPQKSAKRASTKSRHKQNAILSKHKNETAESKVKPHEFIYLRDLSFSHYVAKAVYENRLQKYLDPAINRNFNVSKKRNRVPLDFQERNWKNVNSYSDVKSNEAREQLTLPEINPRHRVCFISPASGGDEKHNQNQKQNNSRGKQAYKKLRKRLKLPSIPHN